MVLVRNFVLSFFLLLTLYFLFNLQTRQIHYIYFNILLVSATVVEEFAHLLFFSSVFYACNFNISSGDNSAGYVFNG
mgnify:CR=1 FL=1